MKLFFFATLLTLSSFSAQATIGISCVIDDENQNTGFYVDTYYPTGSSTYKPRIHTLWFDGKDLVSPDKENSKVSLTMKEVNCQHSDTCTIYAKLDVNGNGKYEGEFVVKYNQNLTYKDEEGGAEYSGVYIDYTKKTKKYLASCTISN